MFKKILSLSLVFCLLPLQTLAFNDVDSNHENYEAIQFVEDLGFFNENDFHPDWAISRGELFEYLARLNGLNNPDSDETISGVSEYLRPFVAKFREIGIRTRIGGEGFEEDKPVNKVTALRMLMNYEGVFIPKQFDKSSYQEQLPNLPTEAYYSNIIAKALDLGLLNIQDEDYNPLSQFTREDLAVMIANMEIYKSRLAEAAGKLPDVIWVGQSSNGLSFLTDEENAILVDVWQTINEEYAYKSELDKQEMFYGMLEGLVDSLEDPYSVFQSPEVHENFIQSLSDSLEGIGAILEEDADGNLKIVSPLKESPAEEAGILPGDIITAIDGLSPANETLSESVNRIRGEAGTEVVLDIKRGDLEKEISIIRAEIDVPSLTYEVTSNDVAIISMNSFGESAAQEFRNFVNEVNTDQLNGIIFDLRNNPGGYVSAATSIAEHFLDEGEVILQLEDSDGNLSEITASNSADISNDLPILVLINQGSASAAEILALALQENLSAELIGQQSYGKGSVQEIVSYVDNSSLKLTTAKWLSPTGLSINHVGIEPNILVEITEEDLEAGRDAVMLEALSRF